MAKYRKGANVQWNWGNGTADGAVEEIFTQKTTRKIKGTEVTREASENCPAYLILQSDGSEVLKSHSELEKI